MVHLLAKRSDTKSNIKLGGFRSQLQASYVSSHTEELWYNKTVCGGLYIYLLTKETRIQSQDESYQKLKKMVLDISLFNTQHYEIWIKWSNPRKGVVPFPTPWCSSYWKGNLRVALDYSHQLYVYITVLVVTILLWWVCGRPNAV